MASLETGQSAPTSTASGLEGRSGSGDWPKDHAACPIDQPACLRSCSSIVHRHEGTVPEADQFGGVDPLWSPATIKRWAEREWWDTRRWRTQPKTK
jgi:hypothetical protein